MATLHNAAGNGGSARLNLKFYAAELPFGSLAVGVDNLHHDVYLSQAWCEQTRAYLLGLLRQITNLHYGPGQESRPAGRPGARSAKSALDTAAWKRQLLELLQGSLTQAKFEKKIEIDILARVAVIKFLTQEIEAQFTALLLEAKEWIRRRGDYFERSEQAHVMKARLAELQAGRRDVYRRAGHHVFHILMDLEERQVGPSRRALFGDEQSGAYELLRNPLAFVEDGRDDVLFVEQYVLLGNYQKDYDRLETFNALLAEFVREGVMASGQAGEVTRARNAYQALLDAAVAARVEVERIEEERAEAARRAGRKAGGALSLIRAGGAKSGQETDLGKIERQLAAAQKKLAELEPRIEAAKANAETLAEEYEALLAGYLDEPENAARLFDPAGTNDAAGAAVRARRLDQWVARLEERGLLAHVLAGYELREIYREYCPPVHLQQLKRALVSREEQERVEGILRQYPARRFSAEAIERLAKKLRRYPQEEARARALRFAGDFMRLRRDLRNYERLTAAMETIQLVRSESTRENSRLNNSLYEFLLASEKRPARDTVLSHVVIKADVRGSTRITQELLARGLNPAALFSLYFYEPVQRILERYSAAKVFIEGDAMVLAIFETESNRAQQRAVSKACALARQILAISAAYNERPEAQELPRLELGVGIAYQGSAPAYWVDGDSRIMISRALNLSDRLSSCSKAAKRILGAPANSPGAAEGSSSNARSPRNDSRSAREAGSMYRVFVFQAGMEGAEEDEADEFLIRFNRNGVELNEEGFQKLRQEIALQHVETDCELPWGRERTAFFVGEAPVGEGLEPLVLRRGFVRQLGADGKIGAASKRAYYEVCTDPRALAMVEELLTAGAARR